MTNGNKNITVIQFVFDSLITLHLIFSDKSRLILKFPDQEDGPAPALPQSLDSLVMCDVTQPEVPGGKVSGGKVLDADQPVPHLQPPFTMGSAAIRDPADIDVSVAGGAWLVHTPCDAEAQAPVCSDKCDLDKTPICLLSSPLHC